MIRMHDEDLVLKSLLAKTNVDSVSSISLSGKNENKFNDEHCESQKQFQLDEDEDVWRPW